MNQKEIQTEMLNKKLAAMADKITPETQTNTSLIDELENILVLLEEREKQLQVVVETLQNKLRYVIPFKIEGTLEQTDESVPIQEKPLSYRIRDVVGKIQLHISALRKMIDKDF